MPEMVEVDLYRRPASHAIGRPIITLSVPDPHVLQPPT